ncbi:MAG: DUF5916 domain-containing protein [Vicinamibacterales bacterium]
MRRLVAAFVLVLSAGTASAQGAPGQAGAGQPFDITRIDPHSFRAIAYRVPDGQAPKIDGHLDEAVWAEAPVQGNFIQREPAFGQPSTEKTEFRILYDDRKIYLGVWAWDDDPSGIIANEMKRDSGLRRSDQLKVVFDTFHDHRNAFYFSTSPYGALKDAQNVENGRTINYDWNAVWENETSIDDKGWYVEIAIPLSQLRFKEEIGEATWGLNLCRIIMRKNEESYWVPFPREWGAGGFARASNAGLLQGMRDIRSRRRMEFLPYVLPRASKDYTTGEGLQSDVQIGGDFKIGITNDLTADLTYHTDFAQVEADQEVVNNTRFSLFFPEKRVFFTESAGIFDYGKSGSSPGGDAARNDPGILPLFYSRRIGLVNGTEVPLIGGGKVTGRVGNYTVGVMNITTEAADLALGGGRTQPIGEANFTAIRVKRNILAQSSIGAILLNRQGGQSDFNRSYGVDMGLLFGSHITLTGLAAKTDSPGEGGDGTAAVADFIWKSDRFNYGLQYADIGRDFNAEMGFIVRTDIRSTKAKAAWTPRPRWRGMRQLFVNGTLEYFENHAGKLVSRTQGLEVQLQRQDTSSLKLTANHEFDSPPVPFATGGTTVPVGDYAWTNYGATWTTNQAKRVYGSVSAEAGGYYNGDRQTYTAAINFQLGKTLLLEPNYTRNQIKLPGHETYGTNVVNFRVSQSFSPDLFVKAFFQYNDDRKTSNINLLFWYIYKPGSDLYIVYNQGWDTNLPGSPSYMVHNRSLAIKMTYWLAR